jgi:predicted O-linked N-acetylglucosamine transferase (SPINDLY family)
LSGLIAPVPDRFVKIAVELAKDESRLKEMRSTLRERVCGSPLMARRAFAAAVEGIYQDIWSAWCAQWGKQHVDKISGG